MKRFAHIFVACLLLCALCVGTSGSALALTNNDFWYTTISGFPLVSTASSVSQKGGYMKAIQRYMQLYNAETNYAVMSTGGVDGYYGTGSANAVKIFQQANGLTPDGICGAGTWSTMAGYLLDANSSNGQYEFVELHLYCPASGNYSYSIGSSDTVLVGRRSVGSTGAYSVYSVNGNGSSWSGPFHTTANPGY